jgi:hypothetical protein
MDLEKAGRDGAKHGTTSYSHEIFHLARQIIRPNGRRVHVASSPAEVEPLKRKLSTVLPDKNEFDIVIHGSGEHVSLETPNNLPERTGYWEERATYFTSVCILATYITTVIIKPDC